MTRSAEFVPERVDMCSAFRKGWRRDGGGTCGLTFELRGRSREGAWPAGRMMDHTGSRAKCLAGGGPSRAKG